MGVQGLLQLLKPALTECNLKNFKGQTCVIDIMSWLYKGQFSTAYNQDLESLGYMGYPLKMLKLLLSFQIKPICIFDGRPHIGKVECEKKRSIEKAKNKALAEQHQKDGNDEEAIKFSTRSLVVRCKQSDLFQEILNLLNIEHYTAPYEADAQMAYMVKEGLADFAITEDSDLIAFGCPKLVLKMNWNGFGQLFDMNAFQKEKDNQKPGWDDKLRYFQQLERDEFLNVCIMGGCEYIQSIKSVGLKVVLKNLQKVKKCEKVVADLKNNKLFKDRVPENYIQEIYKIKQIFQFQTVYDPRSKKFVSLYQPKDGETFDQSYVGELIDPDDVENYATGKLNKKTLQLKLKYIHVINQDVLLNDWNKDQIYDRSMKCIDKSFFEEKGTGSNSLAQRHGAYAYSSKDWQKTKKDFSNEEEQLQIEEEKIKLKIQQQRIEDTERERIALEIKDKILPKEVRVVQDDEFGFQDYESEEDDQINQKDCNQFKIFKSQTIEDYGDQSDEYQHKIEEKQNDNINFQQIIKGKLLQISENVKNDNNKEQIIVNQKTQKLSQKSNSKVQVIMSQKSEQKQSQKSQKEQSQTPQQKLKREKKQQEKEDYRSTSVSPQKQNNNIILSCKIQKQVQLDSKKRIHSQTQLDSEQDIKVSNSNKKLIKNGDIKQFFQKK